MERFFLRLRFDGGRKIASTPASERAEGLDLFWRGYVWGPDAAPASGSFGATGILARAYRCFGEDFPRRIEGAFTAVVIDSARATAVLAHDELALESLFYAPYNDELIVATHLLDIIRATGVGELDETYISDYLAHGWHFGDRTPYSHVRRLRAGETVAAAASSALAPGRSTVSRRFVSPMSAIMRRCFAEQSLVGATDEIRRRFGGARTGDPLRATRRRLL